MTDVLTAEAKRFIRENNSNPFCLYLSHKAVHYPFQPPPKYADTFNGMKVPWPNSIGYRDEWYLRNCRSGCANAATRVMAWMALLASPAPSTDWYRALPVAQGD